jgi:hypothetical protein
MHGLAFGRRAFCIGGSLLGLLAAGTTAHGAVLISDNFNDVASGATLSGRTPATTVNAAKWIAPTNNLKGNGTGGLNGDLTVSNGAGIDLGTNFFANTPGVYDLSVDLTQPTVSSPVQSWVGFGFANGNASSAWDPTQNHVGNNGAPWLIFRLNGADVFFGGPNTTSSVAAGTVSTGTPHTFTVELDTTGANWKANAFLDGSQLDLNGGAAGSSFTYATNPAARYVGVSTGVNVSSGTNSGVATVDNFVLTGPVPAPEPGTVGLLSLAGFGLLAKRRRR